MKKIVLVTLLALSLGVGLSGCNRHVAGTVGGAAVGATIGGLTGGTAGGIIGGAAGAGLGHYLSK